MGRRQGPKCGTGPVTLSMSQCAVIVRIVSRSALLLLSPAFYYNFHHVPGSGFPTFMSATHAR